eukprot:7112325-Prymnesium_polylepis.1
MQVYVNARGRKPAAPAHAACQPGRAAKQLAAIRRGWASAGPAGSTGQSAGVQPCSVRRTAGRSSGAMSAVTACDVA